MSYVVNDGPKNVADETKARVLRAIDELGYRPDPAARLLRGVESNAVALLIPNLVGEFFIELAAKVETEARRRDKTLILGSTNFDSRLERNLISEFQSQRVAAILSIGPTPDLIPGVRSHGSLHLLSSTAGATSVAIGLDQRQVAFDATRHLVGHGRVRVGALFGPMSFPVYKLRYRGWREATAYRSRIALGLARSFDYSHEGGFAAAKSFLDGETTPDAVFVSNDTQAIGLLAGFKVLGVRVPDDIAVISIDGTHIGQFIDPSLTSMDQPAGQMARTALDVVEGIDTRRSEIIIPHRLIVRRSCGCSGDEA